MRLRTNASVVAAGLLALAAVVSSCSNADLAGRILYVDAEGAVVGVVYLDHNGNGARDVLDDPVAGLAMRLVVAGTRSVSGTATTDATGTFRLDGVPVGRFRLEADSAFLGDTLEIFDFADAEITLRAGDTLAVSLGLSFPAFTLAETRGLPEGRKGFVEGIVLNARDPFGDGSIHLQDGEAYLRVVGTQRSATFVPGDSVRFLGRTGRETGQPVLRAEEGFFLAQQVVLPLPLELTTAAAATADDGQKDAALVRIREADIVDTATVTGRFGRDLHVTVDDGSGPLDLVLSEFGGFDLDQIQPDSFSVRDATGLLIPTATADGVVWRLHPRSGADLGIDPIPFPGQVTDLTVVDGTATTLTLNWTEVDDGQGNPSSYVVQYRPVTTLAWTEISEGACAAPVSGTAIGEIAACTLENLEPLTIYFFRVRSFRGTLGEDVEFGPWSNLAGAATAAAP